MLWRLTLLLVACVLLVPPVHAFVPNEFDAIAVSVFPEFPRPYDSVTITVSSSLVDLATSNITIRKDGVVVDEGIGVQQATLTLGVGGTVTRIEVVVVADGQTFSKELTIRPAEVALIVEAGGITPPFFKGAALPVSEGRLRFVALPQFITTAGVSVPSSSLVYTWKVGDQILTGESGVGKNVLSATGPIRYRDARVSVGVRSVDGALYAQASTQVVPVDPLVRIYRNHPLLGVQYEAALSGTAMLQDTEETFRVEPYFFNSLPSFVWRVNSAESGRAADLTLRPSGNNAGSAVVAVTAEMPTMFLSATRSFTLTFGETRSTNIFGF